jgi:hypothetical protein
VVALMDFSGKLAEVLSSTTAYLARADWRTPRFRNNRIDDLDCCWRMNSVAKIRTSENFTSIAHDDMCRGVHR